MKNIIEYAKRKGLTPDSRILQITHHDLDGTVAVINMLNYVNNKKNFYYTHRTYNNIETLIDLIIKDKIKFKKPEFVILTDISVPPELATDLMQYTKPRFLILDHHETAYPLNDISDKYYVDKTETKCGAEVTLDFLKGMGFKSNHALDRLNKIATMYDCWTWIKPENRKFEVQGFKTGYGEMLNRLYFNCGFDKEPFIKRWGNGWDGFNKDEIQFLKDDYGSVKSHIEFIKKNKAFEVIDGKVIMVVDFGEYLNDIAMYFKEEEKYEIVMFYETDKRKINLRSENSENHLGNIMKDINEKNNFILNGGGHKNAAGGFLKNNKYLENFIECFKTYIK